MFLNLQNNLPLTLPRTKDETVARRLRGAFYTPLSATEFMADWIVRRDGESFLEPSFGDGIFLNALAASAKRQDRKQLRIFGVEIEPSVCAAVRHHPEMASATVRCDDFLAVEPFKVNAVIGNPPYVRLRQLPSAQQERALLAARQRLHQPMDPSGSLWMPFVLHAMRFLERSGRLAFVLPYDFTYVRYARPLWSLLGANFGRIEVLRTHERMFPDLMQDVVILLADRYGERTETIRYQAFDRIQDMFRAAPTVSEELEVEAVVSGERAFIRALMGQELSHLLDTRVAPVTVPVRERATFNIGYVTGDRNYFHPTPKEIDGYRIPRRSLRTSVTSTRAMKGTGLQTSSFPEGGVSQLFLPDPQALSEGEEEYILYGAKQGVSERYKCRVRKPWYVVPGTKIPDVLLSVFSECPILVINDAEHYASNSLLCGYRLKISSDSFATGWYTSLTMLQYELEIHALGGGVMVVVPGEAGNIRYPKNVRPILSNLTEIDRLLKAGQVKSAYRVGDQDVLIDQLGLTSSEVSLVRHGVEVLSRWRTSARSSSGLSSEHIPE